MSGWRNEMTTRQSYMERLLILEGLEQRTLQVKLHRTIINL